MAFVTKTWKDRMVEFAGRRKLKNVSTNEAVLYDVSRSEGTVIQAGDSFSATNMNDLEQRIKTEFDNVNSSLNGCSFEQDGEDFYIVGADSVRKKLGNLNMKINLEIVSAIDTNPNGGYMGATSKAVLTITNGIPSISYSGGNSSGAWLNNAYWYGVTHSIKVASFEEI